VCAYLSVRWSLNLVCLSAPKKCPYHDSVISHFKKRKFSQNIFFLDLKLTWILCEFLNSTFLVQPSRWSQKQGLGVCRRFRNRCHGSCVLCLPWWKVPLKQKGTSHVPWPTSQALYNLAKTSANVVLKWRLIGNFRLCVKQVFMQNHSYENAFSLQVHFHSNQTHFHMKGFAWRLVLKQRQGISEMGYLSIFLFFFFNKNKKSTFSSNRKLLGELPCKKKFGLGT